MEIEREWGIKFRENPRMKLTTWLKLKGFKKLAGAFIKFEKYPFKK